MTIRSQLGGVGSVITSDAVWLGENWLRVKRETENSSSVLSREHELRRLRETLREQRARTESAKKLQKDGRTRLNQLEERREKLQRDAAEVVKEHADVRSNLDTARYQVEQLETRRAAIDAENRDIDSERSSADEQLGTSRSRIEQAGAQLQALASRRSELEGQREELRGELGRVRDRASQDREAAQAMAIKFESRRTSKESAAHNLQRMRQQFEQYSRRQQEIRSQLDGGEAPLAEKKEQLEEQLAARVEVETELASARRLVEEIESQLRDLDQARLDIDQAAESARSGVNDANLAVRELGVRREGIAEQFAATDFELATLLEGLDAEATIESWDEKVEKLRKRIDRLGPINLAAIDEFKEQSERKEYLDSQLADLNDALSTLESAIRKIDRETRSRFRETYDNVNAGFQRLFPKLFGGGHAYLELTGDDLLSTGITVMARPPGKRNSTIHLLSGGEKALTAVALVFAIFELNPAPFCMLDEVDAPLDDANVVRFCDIVREMSDRVQFVFITHNKVTMELSRQLTGVTMQEPGVSRLVSVDLDEAVRLAAS